MQMFGNCLPNLSFGIAGALAGLVLSACGGGDAAPTLPSTTELRASCAALAGKVIEGVTVTAANRFEANASSVPSGFCQVLGTRAPFLDIEVDLPDNWTGRYFQQGGSGFDGRIPSALTTTGTTSLVITALNPALAQKGAIYAASNGGNRATVPAEAGPAVWGNGTAAGKQSATDYAYASLGTTMQFAKALSQSLYARRPTYSYFNGCSNGGKNAYAVAQRWPEEFDGIVSGCETMDMGGQTTAWMTGAARPAAANLSNAQSTAVFNAVLNACDGLDGAKDGLISNPQACNFDPAQLQCGAAGASADPAICLSAPQVAGIKTFLSDIKLADGRTIYSRYSWGAGLGQGYGGLGSGFMVLADGDAAWLTPEKQATFDANAMYDKVKSGLMTIGADHDRAAIAAYVASGRKLLSWHAGSDALLSANDHYRNWTDMTKMAGQRTAADIRSLTRFFIVPGAAHGGGGALTQVDWASAIIDWVEKGAAPTQMTYSFTQSSTARTMPVCEYPAYPKYNGTGNINASSSFVCTAP